MREIKFRAWDKAFSKMINFDDTLTKEWILGLTLWGDVIGCDLKALEPKSSHETYIITYPERFELMQYTGLKDSKRTEEYPEGQEIYESDLVSDCEGGIFNVEFSDGKFTANYFEGDKWEHLIDAINECEIVGNKFEGVIK